VGEYRAVLVYGAQVLIERERFNDGNVLVADNRGSGRTDNLDGATGRLSR
jgi:hypothetical protein